MGSSTRSRSGLMASSSCRGSSASNLFLGGMALRLLAYIRNLTYVCWTTMNQRIQLTAKVPPRSDQPVGAVAILASAGGIPALIALLSRIPDGFPLPFFVAQHLPRRVSTLDAIL